VTLIIKVSPAVWDVALCIAKGSLWYATEQQCCLCDSLQLSAIVHTCAAAVGFAACQAVVACPSCRQEVWSIYILASVAAADTLV